MRRAKVLVYSIMILIFLNPFSSCSKKESKNELFEDIRITPTPEKILKRTGQIELNHNFWVIADVSDTSMARLGKYLVKEIELIPGALASIADLYSTRDHEQSITLEIIEDPTIHAQGYNLSITSKSIQISAVSEQGVFYGIQSLIALLKNSWIKNNRSVTLRKMVIKDRPKYSYRFLDFSNIKDSLKSIPLKSMLSSFKINGIIVSSEHSKNSATRLLGDNYVSVFIPGEIDKKNQAIKLDGALKTKDLINAKTASKSDTIIFTLGQNSEDEYLFQIQMASQMGWSGLEQNLLDSLSNN